jgi:site-specific DNA-methyltransferase (adenine-specific)
MTMNVGEEMNSRIDDGSIEPTYRISSADLYVGDVLTVLPHLASESVHAVIADPPYCSGATASAGRISLSTREKYMTNGAAHVLPNFDGDQRDQRSFTYWSTLWLAHCRRLTTPGGVVMVFTDWRQLPSVTDAIQAAGWTWRGIIAWHKPVARVQVGRFTNSCEYIVWASKGSLSRKGKPPLPGMYSQSAPHYSKRIHITEKPVLLLRKLTRIASEGGTVLDPFAGSGSTGVAALLEGHRFVGVELSAHYAEQAAARLDAAGHGHADADADPREA